MSSVRLPGRGSRTSAKDLGYQSAFSRECESRRVWEEQPWLVLCRSTSTVRTSGDRRSIMVKKSESEKLAEKKPQAESDSKMNATAPEEVEGDLKAPEDARVEEQTEEHVSKELPLRRQMSSHLRKALEDTSRPATRSEKTKTLISYAKYIVLGNRVRSNGMDADKPEVGGNAGSDLDVSFKVAFETSKRDKIKVLKLHQQTTFEDVRASLKKWLLPLDSEKDVVIRHLHFPKDDYSDLIRFEPVDDEDAWRDALQEFHFQRRSVACKALDSFVNKAVNYCDALASSAQLKGFQMCTELARHQDLNTRLPNSTLNAAKKAILESESLEVRNAASLFTWTWLVASAACRKQFLAMKFAQQLVSDRDFCYYINGNTGEHILKHNVAGIFSTVLFHDSSIGTAILEEDPSMNLFAQVIKGGQTSAKFERITFKMGLQILLVLGAADSGRVVAGFAERSMFNEVFRSPSKNDPDVIWQLQLKCLSVLTPSMGSITNAWDSEALIHRLKIFSGLLIEKRSSANLSADSVKDEKSNEHALAAISACLWAIAETGVTLGSDGSRIVLDLLEVIEPKSLAAQCIAGAVGSMACSHANLIRDHPFITKTLLKYLEEGDEANTETVTGAIQKVAYSVPEAVVEADGLSVIAHSLRDKNMKLAGKSNLMAILMVLAYNLYRQSWEHGHIDVAIDFLQECIKFPKDNEQAKAGAQSALTTAWCLARNPSHRKVLATTASFKGILQTCEIFGTSDPNIMKFGIGAIWALSYDPECRACILETKLLSYLTTLLSTAPRVEGNIVDMVKGRAAADRKKGANAGEGGKKKLSPIKIRPQSASPKKKDKGDNPVRKSQRPKSAVPPKKGGLAGISEMTRRAKTPTKAVPKKKAREELPPIPAYDKTYRDPRSDMWYLIVNALWIIQHNDQCAKVMCKSELPEMLLRICFSSSKTVAPSVRCVASDLLQILNRKMKRLEVAKDLEKEFKEQQLEKMQTSGSKPKKVVITKSEPVQPDCKTFVKTGKCPHGKKCKFRHPDPEEEKSKELARKAEAATRAKEAAALEGALPTFELDAALAFIGHPQFCELFVITLFVSSQDAVLQSYAAKMLAHLAMGSTMKSIARHLGVFDILFQYCKNDPYEQRTVYAMQAIMNLSTLPANQKYLGQHGFRQIMKLSCMEGLLNCKTREYAQYTIINLGRHPSNRTRIYKEELRLKAEFAHGKLKPCHDQQYLERFKTTTSARDFDTRPQSPSALNAKSPQRRFDNWYEEMRRSLASPAKSSSSLLNDSNCLTFLKDDIAPIPLIRPDSPGFKADWTLSRRSDLSSGEALTVSVDADLAHQLRSPMSGMFDRQKKMQYQKPVIRRPGSAPTIKRRSRALSPPAGDRWAPKVDHFETLAQKFDPLMPQPSILPVKVYLNPSVGANNEIAFSGKGGGIVGSGSPPRLVKWENVKGNRISEAINLQSYTLPDGKSVHFYENKGGLFDEDPGSSVSPAAPENLEDLYIVQLPAETADLSFNLKILTAAENDTPAIPDELETNLIEEVYKNAVENIVFFHCDIATDEDKSEQQKRKKMNDRQRVRPVNWELDSSVFQLRAHENDGGDLFTSEDILNKAFEVDWKKCTSKLSFWAFVTGEYPPGPFQVGDEVEVKFRNAEVWYPATVEKLRPIEGSVDVRKFPNKDGQKGRRQKRTAFEFVRFPGGAPGGKLRDADRALQNVVTKKVEVLEKNVPDVCGLDNSQLRRIEAYSGAKIKVCTRNRDDFVDFVISGTEAEVKMGTTVVEQAVKMTLVKQTLRDYYALSHKVFNFFKAKGHGSVFSMQLNEFNGFLSESKLDGELSRYESSQIFDVVNDTLTKTFLEVTGKGRDELRDELDDDRSIVRFEWQECILRLACKLFEKKSGIYDYKCDHVAMPKAINELFSDYIIKYLGDAVLLSPNKFRSEKFYTHEIEKVILYHAEFLIDLFVTIAGSNTTEKLASYKERGLLLSVSEWNDFLKAVEFIDTDFSRREATFSLIWSSFAVVDDVACADRARMLTFFEFIEALCRLCTMKTMPDADDLREAGVTDIVSYDNLKSTGGLRRKNVKSSGSDLESINAKASKAQDILDPRDLSIKFRLLLKLLESKLPALRKWDCGEGRKKFMAEHAKALREALRTRESDLYSNLLWKEVLRKSMAREENSESGKHMTTKTSPNKLVVVKGFKKPGMLVFQKGLHQSSRHKLF